MPADRAFVDAYADELHAAAVRLGARSASRRRRPVLGPVVAVVACAAIAVGTLLAIARPEPAQAAVHLRVADGRVVVTLVDLEHSPERIEAAVRSAGLDVTVVAVPVGTSEVGRFVGNVATDLPPEIRVVDGGRSTFAGFSLPVGWVGSLHLKVGRPARPGEAYETFSDAFAPGEPLACSQLHGRAAADVLAWLADHELGVTFLAVAPGTGARHLEPDDLGASGMAGWLVVAAHATAADRVVVELAPSTGAGVTGPVPC